MRIYNVVPRAKGWAVVKPGNDKATRTFVNKYGMLYAFRQAQGYAIESVLFTGGEVYSHDVNGRIISVFTCKWENQKSEVIK